MGAGVERKKGHGSLGGKKKKARRLPPQGNWRKNLMGELASQVAISTVEVHLMCGKVAAK